jgi:hypothetical protein
MTRRERYQRYMARVAAAAGPELAIAQQLYVHPPQAISDVIVGHLELDPASRHLLVGSIGAGKTTQLLVATNKLNASADLVAVYLDVSEKQDLVKLQTGCLVALAGLALLQAAPTLGSHGDRTNFKGWCEGYIDEWPYGDEEPPDGYVEGVVVPPASGWPDIPASNVERLAGFHAGLRATGRTLVVLFDSLDRTTNREAFTKLVDQDLAALKRCGIGVVLIGPIRSLEGFGRLDVDRFDKLHLQGPVDVEQDPAGKEFLFRVLRARAEEELLPDPQAYALVMASGGVLRDLISLAKAAGDEAYLSGADRIGTPHVEAAIESFGRSLMIGLRQEEVDTLKHLRSSGGFVRTSEHDLALLATRRILEYPRRALRYGLHPTIGPLLDQKAG